jgi:hypothetical protein
MKIDYFDWDDRNIEHIEGHGVTPDEVEEIFLSKYLILKTRTGRYLAFGKTVTGRYLVAVFEISPQTKIIRVITARDMDSKDKKLYKRKVR